MAILGQTQKDKDFNNAIKETEREIKGYVEVIYADTNNSSYYPEYPEKAKISGTFEINDGNRKNKNYASLEENYTKLDGSFLLPNKNVVGDHAGYISTEIFEKISNKKVILDVNNPLISEEHIVPVIASGITIYFFNNVANDFELKIISENDEETIFNIKNNTQSVFHQFFENDITIKKMELTITTMEYPNRRIRITEIDFGISNLYEDNELVSFTTNEEIDLFIEKLPINDCTINLNNYTNDFDPLNPKGLIKYLTENCVIKPFVGVAMKTNGVDYRSLGYYYLRDWSADTNGNVTLNGQSYMGILSNLALKDDPTRKILSNIFKTPSELNSAFNSYYNYTFSLDSRMNFWNTGETNLMNNIIAGIFRYIGIGALNSSNILYISRDNKLIENEYYEKLVSPNFINISLNELLEEPKVEIRQKISKINFKVQSEDFDNIKTEILLEQEHTLNSETEEIWFKFSKLQYSLSNNATLTYTTTGSGSAELYDSNIKLCYIKMYGKKGDKFNLKVTAQTGTVTNKENTITYFLENENGREISYDFTNYQMTLATNIEKIAKNLITRDYKYKISGNFNGNPLLEPRIKANVETKFGNKNIVITKITNTFDGGLTGYFEGVGN